MPTCTHARSRRALIAMLCATFLALMPTTLAAQNNSGDQPAFNPGQITRIEHPGYRNYVLVHLPANYTPDRAWPVILNYHGLNGKPTLSPFKHTLGGEHFIIIGMDYSSKAYHEELDRNVANRAKQHLAGVLQRLSRFDKLNMDKDRLILSGISQGGYSATVLGEAVLDQLAGIVMLSAGRTHYEGHHPPPMDKIRGMPIYIGVGENDDPHRERGEKSARLYRDWGANVTLTVWPNRGHSPKKDDQKLRRWLLALGPLANAAQRLDAAERAAKAGDTAQAYRAYRKLADLSDAHPASRKAAQQLSALKQQATAQLEQAGKQIEREAYAEAVTTLVNVSNNFAGTDAAQRATQRLKALRGDAETAQLIDQAMLDRKAKRLHEQAKTAKQRGRHTEALEHYAEYVKTCEGATGYENVKAEYATYRQTQRRSAADALRQRAARAEQRDEFAQAMTLYGQYVEKFGDMAGAEKVKQKLAALKVDPRVARQRRDAQVADECKPMLAMARSYIRADMPEKARPLLEKIVEDHGETSWADKARSMLDDLN